MMKPKLTIKEKSFPTFLGQFLIFDENSHQMQSAHLSKEKREYTPSVFTNKVIFLRKDCGLKDGETIRFIHKDHTNSVYKPVLCTHTYKAEEYDDITFKLNLIESTIEPFDE